MGIRRFNWRLRSDLLAGRRIRELSLGLLRGILRCLRDVMLTVIMSTCGRARLLVVCTCRRRLALVVCYGRRALIRPVAMTLLVLVLVRGWLPMTLPLRRGRMDSTLRHRMACQRVRQGRLWYSMIWAICRCGRRRRSPRWRSVDDRFIVFPPLVCIPEAREAHLGSKRRVDRVSLHRGASEARWARGRGSSKVQVWWIDGGGPFLGASCLAVPRRASPSCMFHPPLST